MTIQVRNAVFETNSSSSHSVTVSGNEMVDFGLSKDELRSGVIHIERSGDFGWRFEEFRDTHSKIAYMIIQSDTDRLGYLSDDETWVDLVPTLKETGAENTRWLIDLIENATGCTLEIQFGSYSGIDHQSHGEGEELFGDANEMRRFLFSSESTLKTGNDNDDAYGSTY